jgi:hypothetical protein
VIDALFRFADRHKPVLTAAGIAWFAFGCAVTAGFVALPDWRFMSDEVVLYSGAAYNAIWWGFVRPAIVRRRATLFAEPITNG